MTASRRRGEVGDGDPLQAIEDALRTFGADEIVISTHPEGRSHWLAHNVVGAARGPFRRPDHARRRRPRRRALALATAATGASFPCRRLLAGVVGTKSATAAICSAE